MKMSAISNAVLQHLMDRCPSHQCGIVSQKLVLLCGCRLVNKFYVRKCYYFQEIQHHHYTEQYQAVLRGPKLNS